MIDEFFAYREPAAVGVSFRRSGKIYYFAPNGVRVRQGEQVVAETDKGVDIGEVVFIKFEFSEAEKRQLKPLVRKATPEDLAHEQELQLKEREARKVCEQKIIEHKLPMRLIAADYTFDAQRLVFFFSSEGRVDFRDLVRDLAEIFHTRIELRQVGVRDQAKMVGGLGPCGRPLCCNAFLRNFDPVGIRVAKDQGLSLNPAKISGICDRLMCCLKYEHQTYLDLAKKLPKVGQKVNTRQGVAEVRAINLMHERLSVRYPDDSYEDVKAAEVWRLDEEAPPLPEVKPTEDGEMPPEDNTLPLMVRQRPKQAQGAERPQRSERSERPSRGRPERGARPERPAAPERPGRPESRPAQPPAPPRPAQAAPPAEGEGEAAGTSKRRRRRRPDRRGGTGEGQQPAQGQPQAAPPQGQSPPPRPQGERRPQPERKPQPQGQPQGAPQAEGAPGQPAGERSARRRRPRFRSRNKPGGEGGGGEAGSAPSSPPSGGGE